LVDAEHVCLVQNQRPNVGAVLWEVPAGTLEPGEDPARAAERELAEETGYRAGRWAKLTEFYPSPGVLSEKLYVYVAQDLTPGPQDLEDDEEIHPHTIPWTQALAWARDGTICDGKTLIALLLWQERRKEGH